MKIKAQPRYEVVDVKTHQDKDYLRIITLLGPEKETIEVLRDTGNTFLHGVMWYTWPELLEITNANDARYAYDYYQRVKRLNPPALANYELKPKGVPTRCMYCHTDMSGLSASCMACGGAMHLSCAFENGNECVTPGCSSQEKEKKKDSHTHRVMG